MNLLRIITFISLFFFLSILNVNAFDQSRYWTVTQIGPKSSDDAIKILKNVDRSLNPVEGIWLQENLGKVAIIKDENLNMLFRKYIIDNDKDPKLNGSIIGSLNRVKDVDKYLIFEKIKDNDNNFTGMGFLNIYLDYPKKNKKAISLQERQKLFKNLKTAKKAEGHIFKLINKKKFDLRFSLKRIYP